MIRPENSSFWAAVSNMVGGATAGVVVRVGVTVDGARVMMLSSGSGSGSQYEFDVKECRGGGGSGLRALTSVQCCLCPVSSLIEY